MTTLLTAFGVSFVAEIGDKSMLLVAALAARYRLSWLLVALVIEAATAMALAVLVGGTVGEVLPDRALRLAAAAIFLGVGVWMLVSPEEAGELIEPARTRQAALPVIAALIVPLFISELGDKTQLSAASLAGVHADARLGIWAGATAGMVAGDILAALLGARLGVRLRGPTLRLVAATMFLVVGVASVLSAVI